MDITQNYCGLLLFIFLLSIDSGLSIAQDDDYFDEASFNRCPWIRNKLKNGRVRYRYKGRVAKFICDSGFELAGKRSSTCVRGQWSNPVPVCVARGCSRVPPVVNGRITEMYRGALLVYDCNPGYLLDGSPTIHCDGRRWNTSPPVCLIPAEPPETYCEFENPNLCGWTQDPNHDFDWQRNQFSTPSGHVGTGPAFDHTFGENKAGFYLYIEASSPRKINDTARLFSPVYPPELSGGCFTFWYHMYGATTGGIRVYLKPENHVFDELKPNWEKFGDQGNQWLKGHMIVTSLHQHFQIIIEGIRGESYVGDTAIDDLRLTATLCDSDDNNTDTTATVDEYSCRGRCQDSGNESSCGCNANCVDEPNFCCRDYYLICTSGNYTTVRNTDEPLPEDYTTSSLTASKTIHSSTEADSAETQTSVITISTDSLKSTTGIGVISSITSASSSSSPKTETSTKNFIPHVDDYSKDPLSSTLTTIASGIALPTTRTFGISSSTQMSQSTLKLTTNIQIRPNKTLSREKTTTTSIISTPSTTPAQSTHPSPSTIPISSTTTTPSTTSISSTTSTPSTTLTPFTTATSLTTPSTSSTISTTSIPPTSHTSPTTTTTTSTTPQSTLSSTQRVTTPTTIQATKLTTKQSTLQTESTDTTTLSPTIQTTRESSHQSVFVSSIMTTSTPSLVTDLNMSSSSAAKVSNKDPISSSTTAQSSTRKIYNLRPRSTTVSTTTYTSAPVTRKTYPLSIETTTVSSTPTTAQLLTSWHRYSISVSNSTKSTSYSYGTTTISVVPLTTNRSNTPTETTPTTRSHRFSRPTKGTLPKSSDFYESKSTKTSSNSSMPVIISIIIITLICLIAGLAYYFKKQRNKRQSKLSDDSEMRFLPDSDYMEYSDASALDQILVK